MITVPILLTAKEQAQANYDRCLRYYNELQELLKTVKKSQRNVIQFRLAIYENYVGQAKNNLIDITNLS